VLPDQWAAIDAWIAKQKEPDLSRPEAIRKRLYALRTRAPEELAAAGCPVLFIAGDEDVLIPPIAADIIAAVVPGARAVHIADAGHSAYFERAQVFNRHVAEFLDPTA
jgi:pimeloyl-ACP methyl ester carboxylesterase